MRPDRCHSSSSPPPTDFVGLLSLGMVVRKDLHSPRHLDLGFRFFAYQNITKSSPWAVSVTRTYNPGDSSPGRINKTGESTYLCGERVLYWKSRPLNHRHASKQTTQWSCLQVVAIIVIDQLPCNLNWMMILWTFCKWHSLFTVLPEKTWKKYHLC